MTPVVFCRSCARDVDRFELQAWTVAKHLGVTHFVCVDEAEVPLFENVRARVGGKLHVRATPPEAVAIKSPYLRQQYVKLVSDRVCGLTGPEAALFHLDSDMYVDENIVERWQREKETWPWYYAGLSTDTQPALSTWRPLLALAGSLVEREWSTAWMQPFGWWIRRFALAGLRNKMATELAGGLFARPFREGEQVGPPPSFIDVFQTYAQRTRMAEYQLYGAYVSAAQKVCGPLYHPLVDVSISGAPLGVVHRSSQFELKELPELLRKERGR